MSDAARDDHLRARPLPRHTGQGGRGGRRVGLQDGAGAAGVLAREGPRGSNPWVAGH